MINYLRRLGYALLCVGVAVGYIWAGGDQARAAESLPIQVDYDRTAVWMEDVLNSYISHRAVVVGDQMYEPSSAAEYCAVVISPVICPQAETITVRPQFSKQWEFKPTKYRRGVPNRFYTAIKIHELGHRSGDTLECLGVWPSIGINVEEGVVDAITVDLMPAYGWKFHRRRGMSAYISYPKDVSYLRAVAVSKVGGMPYKQNPEARRWMRKLWGGSCEDREAMIGVRVAL